MWTTQRNMRIHVFAASVVVSFSLFLGLTRVDFLLVVFAIILVLSAEVLNTLAESLVDLLTPGYASMAKVVKDVAAGGVLLAAGFSVVTGVAVFVPEVLRFARMGWGYTMTVLGARLPRVLPLAVLLVVPPLVGLFLPVRRG